jgi:hypothetical protein
MAFDKNVDHVKTLSMLKDVQVAYEIYLNILSKGHLIFSILPPPPPLPKFHSSLLFFI